MKTFRLIIVLIALAAAPAFAANTTNSPSLSGLTNPPPSLSITRIASNTVVTPGGATNLYNSMVAAGIVFADPSSGTPFLRLSNASPLYLTITNWNSGSNAAISITPVNITNLAGFLSSNLLVVTPGFAATNYLGLAAWQDWLGTNGLASLAGVNSLFQQTTNDFNAAFQQTTNDFLPLFGGLATLAGTNVFTGTNSFNTPFSGSIFSITNYSGFTNGLVSSGVSKTGVSYVPGTSMSVNVDATFLVGSAFTFTGEFDSIPRVFTGVVDNAWADGGYFLSFTPSFDSEVNTGEFFTNGLLSAMLPGIVTLNGDPITRWSQAASNAVPLAVMTGGVLTNGAISFRTNINGLETNRTLQLFADADGLTLAANLSDAEGGSWSGQLNYVAGDNTWKFYSPIQFPDNTIQSSAAITTLLAGTPNVTLGTNGSTLTINVTTQDFSGFLVNGGSGYSVDFTSASGPEALASNQFTTLQQVNDKIAAISGEEWFGTTNAHPNTQLAGALQFKRETVGVWTNTYSATKATNYLGTLYMTNAVSGGVNGGTYIHTVNASVSSSAGSPRYYSVLVLSDGPTTNTLSTGTQFSLGTAVNADASIMFLSSNLTVSVTNMFLGVSRYVIRSAGTGTASIYGGTGYHTHLTLPGTTFQVSGGITDIQSLAGPVTTNSATSVTIGAPTNGVSLQNFGWHLGAAASTIAATTTTSTVSIPTGQFARVTWEILPNIGQVNASDRLAVRVNGDTGTNYWMMYHWVDGWANPTRQFYRGTNAFFLGNSNVSIWTNARLKVTVEFSPGNDSSQTTSFVRVKGDVSYYDYGDKTSSESMISSFIGNWQGGTYPTSVSLFGVSSRFQFGVGTKVFSEVFP
jgi:hypothetical protein